MSFEHLTKLREKVRQLPAEPGVYLMRDAGGEIIYIGKAKALRNRVGSYFRALEGHEDKTQRLMHAMRDFETIVTASEFEALVLECSMIKQYQPKYNILLKDDKGYHYIRLSQEPYPRITAEMQLRSDDGAKWIGPYTSSFVVRQTVDEVNKAFMLPTCKRKFPEDIGKARACLNFHIEQCIGLCRGKITRQRYGEIIEQAERFITQGASGSIELLTERMEAASENLDFERAAFYRDRIKAIKKLAEHQNVVFAKAEDQDVLGIIQNEKESCAALLKIRRQRLVDKQTFQLREIESLPATRAEFILSYYGQSGAEIPGTILLDGECEDTELIERYLREHKGRKVTLHQPSRGEGLRLVKMASANAAQELAHKIERTGREIAALDELARLLGLSSPPGYIEAYDISNYGGQTIVGGMVVFENGRPLKAAYKKFNIKTLEGPDDYGALKEMLSRRLGRYNQEKITDVGFGRLPDLILLDGGVGQLSAARSVFDELGLEVPMFGMVKDGKHKTRAIASSGGEIAIASSRSAFALVTKIQEEVHRFSLASMQTRHKKSGFALRLTQVEGIGEKRAAALLKHFKTQKALNSASVEELAAAPGMSAKTAQAVFEFLKCDA
ncbi:MAG: excinuclease ABC subunit UvrC [Oscillospiraceae bacterium]|nr:excinuclease ABC subunit UvrC [Oscillospiraceae bacterium]